MRSKKVGMLRGSKSERERICMPTLSASACRIRKRSGQAAAPSAVAVTTRSVRMGTAIVPTFPRHPLVVAQQ